MATIDLRTETVGVVPVKGIDAQVIIEIPVDATKVSGGLVNGNTYKYGQIPAGFVLEMAGIRVKTLSALTGTSTLTDGSIVPLAAQIMNAIGMFYGTTNVPKYYKTGGTISGLIATADIADAKFDVVLKGYMLQPE
jgi:hypothetical protein